MATRSSELRISMFTWNVFTQQPPGKILSDIVQVHIREDPDIYIVGLQEVRSRPVEYVLQTTVMYDPWTTAISEEVCKHRYVLVSSQRLQGLSILVFSLMDRLPFLRQFDKTFARRGLGGFWGNKGAVSIRFECFEKTFCIVVAHLSAPTEYEEQRHQDFHSIVNTEFMLPGTPPILDHDYVFWLGDLNFKNPDSRRSEHPTKQEISVLKEQDRLVLSMKERLSFEGFKEGKIDFDPTYKFLVGKNTYDIRAAPAWTDRILWKAKHPEKVKQLNYDSHNNVLCSDHKPVWADFKVEVSAGPSQAPVVFETQPDCQNGNLTCSYKVTSEIVASEKDWIGLYKIGFKTIDWHYHAYVWASEGDGCKVSFDKSSLPVDGGEYVLCYNSYLMECVLGISNAFKI